MPRTGRAIRWAKQTQAVEPAACIFHGGPPRSDACPKCLAASKRSTATALRAAGQYAAADDFEAAACELEAS